LRSQFELNRSINIYAKNCGNKAEFLSAHSLID